MNSSVVLPVAALILFLLAVLALSRVKGRRGGRGRSRRRSGRSLSRLLAHRIPFDRKEKPAEKRERQAREFRRYQREHPGATKMPADYYHQPPPPSPVAARLRRVGRWVKAQTWGRAVTWVREHTSPF